MTTQVGGLPELSRDSVEMTKEVIMAEQELEAEDCRPLEGVEHTPVKPKSELAANLSGLSPSELVLVERSQDSVQVTKKRMERDHRRQPIHNTESDASCDTLEDARVVCTAGERKNKKIKTRFFIGGQVSVPPESGMERKSVGRRISEVFGLRSPKSTEATEHPVSGEQDKANSDGHVTFQKFPEIID